jgi:hypothetical protein
MRARLVALVTAAVVGTAGGVTTALVTATDGAGDDPLGIGAEQVDLDCTGEPVLVVAAGDTAAALRPAVLNSPPDETVRYLDTDRSCDARWTAENSTKEPAWVAYVGPGDATELCLDRMSVQHKGDNVTFLRSGSRQRAECVCEVPASAAPRLEPGMEGDAGTDIWIRALQNLFVTIDESRSTDEPHELTRDDLTGEYDARTQRRVDALREANGEPATGVVDEFVWTRLTNTGCQLYDYR